MAWWRHNPSLITRSPAHHYAQRILRDHEATLRTRCFSRAPSNTAQHQEHDGARRPEGMTDREWAQLQRYRRWRKILQEHPYKGLFGASEDMLRGKGLTDWEWVYKTFPKWMLQEMDPQEVADQNKNVDKDSHSRLFVQSCVEAEVDSYQDGDTEIGQKPTYRETNNPRSNESQHSHNQISRQPTTNAMSLASYHRPICADRRRLYTGRQ